MVLGGLLLLLDNLGVLRVDNLWNYWPAALIALGAVRIGESRRPASLVWGGIMIAVGTILLLQNLEIWYFRMDLLWPLAIVAVGIGMVLRAVDRNRMVDGQLVDADPTISLWAMFGGSERRVLSADFRGGEAFAVCGGFKIDLRGSQMPSGRAVLEINTIFGGCDIQIPDSWRVNMKGIGIFGGFADKSIPPNPASDSTAPVLVVTGTCLFGGVQVKN